jgi:hypothetical protein
MGLARPRAMWTKFAGLNRRTQNLSELSSKPLWSAPSTSRGRWPLGWRSEGQRPTSSTSIGSARSVAELQCHEFSDAAQRVSRRRDSRPLRVRSCTPWARSLPPCVRGHPDHVARERRGGHLPLPARRRATLAQVTGGRSGARGRRDLRDPDRGHGRRPRRDQERRRARGYNPARARALLKAMREASGGVGLVCPLASERAMARGVRTWLRRAGVNRPAPAHHEQRLRSRHSRSWLFRPFPGPMTLL